MKTINRIALLLLVVFSSSGLLSAQEKHEFSVWGAGGLSSLKYDTSFGERKSKLGGALGLGYTFFFSDHFGIGTGAEVALYNTRANISGLKDSYDIYDLIEEETANLRVNFKEYQENQRLTSVNIPLFLQYQTGQKHRFYAAIGAKVGFPVDSKFKIKDSEYVVSAYYPSTNQELFDPMYPAGYGTHNAEKIEGDLNFKTMYMGLVEAGIKWQLGNSKSLYTGAYFDYGFNDIYDGVRNKSVIEYGNNIPLSINHNSVLNSKYQTANQTQRAEFSDKVKPFSVGLKLKLAFGASRSKQTRNIDSGIVPVPVTENVDLLKREVETARREAEAAKRDAEAARREAEAMRKKAEAAQTVKKEAETKIGFILNDFSLDKADIKPEHIKIMDECIENLKKYPNVKLDLTGYTCDLGSDSHNYELGLKRAEKVRLYFQERGISKDRINIMSEGSNNPQVPNTSEKNRLINRRVVGVGQ